MKLRQPREAMPLTVWIAFAVLASGPSPTSWAFCYSTTFSLCLARKNERARPFDRRQAIPLRALLNGRIGGYAERSENHARGNAVVGPPTRLIVYCGDYKCAHSVVISAERWLDEVRLSDLETKFTCQFCLTSRPPISVRSSSKRRWGNRLSMKLSRFLTMHLKRTTWR